MKEREQSNSTTKTQSAILFRTVDNLGTSGNIDIYGGTSPTTPNGYALSVTAEPFANS